MLLLPKIGAKIDTKRTVQLVTQKEPFVLLTT